MKRICKIDLHMHSTVSDGTDTPEELLRKVREAEIDLFALTDHDAVAGYGMIRKILRPDDPQVLSGAEFSYRDGEGKYHILGYGFDPKSEPIRRLIDTGHGYRMKKVRARLDFLENTFGFEFPEEAIQQLLELNNPGKPHIGNLMVEYGYAATKEEAISEYINQISFQNEYVRPEEAIQAILGGGGIPVLAHPPFGSGEELIVGDEMEHRLQRLIGFGLQGLEGFYSGYTPKLRMQMLRLAEKYDLYITAGSDYHGTNKLVTLGNIGVQRMPVIPGGLRRFLEAFGVM